jgi:glycosyltransferase involved in cell wall biosynthesis
MLLRTIQTILTLKELPQSDAIYTPGDFLSNTMPAVVHRIIHPSVPWVTHVYIVIPTPARRKLSFLSDLISWSLQRASLQLVKSFSTIVVVLDGMTGKQLVQAGVPSRKIYVSSGGIPLAQVDNTPPEGIAHFDGCFVGRIHPSKGVFDLVDIWSKVCKEIPNAKLVVIGDGAEPYVTKLKKTIQDLSMEEQISLKGFRQNPFGWMKASRVFIYPDHEIIYGWGLAVAEALACSIPAVVYDQPGHREAFKDGLVTVPRWDSDRYAEEVVRLLKDDSYRIALGSNGRRAIEDYDWARVSDRLLKVIRDSN